MLAPDRPEAMSRISAAYTYLLLQVFGCRITIVRVIKGIMQCWVGHNLICKCRVQTCAKCKHKSLSSQTGNHRAPGNGGNTLHHAGASVRAT